MPCHHCFKRQPNAQYSKPTNNPDGDASGLYFEKKNISR